MKFESDFEKVEVDASLSQEIDRQIAAYDRGETTASSFEESLAEIRQTLLVARAKREAAANR